MQHIFVLERFLLKLRTNTALRGITLPDACTSTKYFIHAKNITVLVTSRTKIEQVRFGYLV